MNQNDEGYLGGSSGYVRREFITVCWLCERKGQRDVSDFCHGETYKNGGGVDISKMEANGGFVPSTPCTVN